jgi:DNA repair protein RecO (recombination protein O)
MPNKTSTVEGYVLFAAKYQEKDALITLLSGQKKLSVRIRGGEDVTSKNHEATLVFNKVALDVSQSNEGYLTCTGTKTISNYASLYENLPASIIGQMCNEIILKCFTDDDNIPTDFYAEALKALFEGFDPLTVGFIFACACIKCLGLGPDLDGCVNCAKKTGLVSFSLEEGGFLCAQCAAEANYPVMDKDYLKVMRYGFMVSAEQMEHAVLPPVSVKKALGDDLAFIQSNLGCEIKSFSLLEKTLK